VKHLLRIGHCSNQASEGGIPSGRGIYPLAQCHPAGGSDCGVYGCDSSGEHEGGARKFPKGVESRHLRGLHVERKSSMASMGKNFKLPHKF